MKLHKLKYIKTGPNEGNHDLAMRLLSSYSKCPKCNLSENNFKIFHRLGLRRYKKYIGGLFSIDMIGARMKCDNCASEWWEECSIENTFEFNPLTGMCCLWFFLIFTSVVAIIELIKLMNMISIPVEIRTADFNHAFNNALALECLSIFIICTVSVSIFVITSNKNKREDGRE